MSSEATFKKSLCAMVAEVVGGASVIFDGQSVMDTYAPVGTPGTGVGTTWQSNAIKRALTKPNVGMNASGVNAMLAEMVGVETSSSLRLDRSGATRFVFTDTSEE